MTEIADALSFFGRFKVRPAFFRPTQTSLSKSILDAVGPVRDFLASNGFHDFSSQKQGSAHKVRLEVQVVTQNKIEKTYASFYRPETKSGDPRMWITGLPQLANAGALMAFFGNSKTGLYLINMDDSVLLADADRKNSALYSSLNAVAVNSVSKSAEKLRLLLEDISSRGYVDSLRKGDTGIGYTLEALLGIKANSSKSPDFEGIEIKAKRSSSATKSNLFSQVADFQCSKFKSYEQVLDEFGYVDRQNNRLSLKVTISDKPFTASNTQKYLYLSVSQDDTKLYLNELLKSGSSMEVLEWQMDYLKWRLDTKHAETFWVEADRKRIAGLEKFHYTSATHTLSPFTDQLPLLLSTGIVTVDLTAHRDNKPNSLFRNHGMLFKISRKNFGALFPPSFEYDLVTKSTKIR